MGSRGLLIKGASYSYAMCHSVISNCRNSSSHFGFPKGITIQYQKVRSYSSTTRSSLQPPDVPRLAETARISLTSTEIEEFAPKIKQLLVCEIRIPEIPIYLLGSSTDIMKSGGLFGQLQGVDLQSIEPSIRADTEGNNLRDDVAETFDNRDDIIGAVPNYEEPYIKVPGVLNTE